MAGKPLIKELEQRKSDKAEEVQADFLKEEAMRQYEKHRRVELNERGMSMFDDTLRLRREI